MDHRGRELREVGLALHSSWQALQASLLTRPVADHPPSRARLRRPKPPAVAVDHEAEIDALTPLPAFDTHGLTIAKRLRRGLVGAIAAAVVTLLCLAALGGDRPWAALERLRPNMDAMARLAGFGIDQVTLSGYRFALDRDVFNALDLGNVKSFLSLDAEAVKTRIERVPWIASAEIKRVYPNRLDVRITERKAYALWRRGEESYLIDDTGRVLTGVGSARFPDLLQISGEGAAAEAAALMKLIARYPEIARRLSEAERVNERRWTLRLTGGVSLILPPDGEAHVLESIARDASLGRLVAGERATIDFRVPGRITVRAEGEPAGAKAETKAGQS
jgi:cell division protein FtsQ